MKKKIILFSLIILVALIVFALIAAAPFWIQSRSVTQIELGGFNHFEKEQAVLSKEETDNLIALYNISWFGGEVTAEPGCDAYWFAVTFQDGSTLTVTEGVRSKMIVRPQDGEPYYITNGALIAYLMDLLEKYDLPVE